MHRVSIFGNWAWITWWGFSRKEQRCWLGKHWAKYLIKRHHLWLLIKETVSWTNRDLWSGLLPGIYSFLQGWVGFSGKLNYPFLRSSPRMVKSLKIQLAWTPTLTMQKSVMTIFNFLDVCHQSPSFRWPSISASPQVMREGNFSSWAVTMIIMETSVCSTGFNQSPLSCWSYSPFEMVPLQAGLWTVTPGFCIAWRSSSAEWNPDQPDNVAEVIFQDLILSLSSNWGPQCKCFRSSSLRNQRCPMCGQTPDLEPVMHGNGDGFTMNPVTVSVPQ